MSELNDMEDTSYQAPVVQLGGQPIHPEPLSPSQITDQETANSGVVNDLYKEIQAVIVSVEGRIPNGVDANSRHLRSFISYNKALLATVVK
jgi:hypothetical protein